MASGSQTFNSTSTWTCPVGVIQVTAETWGGGGAGGTGSLQGEGGGGGGAYSSAVVQVQPGLTYTVTVGLGSTLAPAAGGDTWFVDASTVLAKGGGSATNRTGGTGGVSGSCIGTTKRSGGNGGTSSGANAGGGGGGGSATSAAVGNNGAANTGGTGGAGGTGQATGGVGTDHLSLAINNGGAPGAGGGGASDGGGTSGSGGDGRVVLTWTAVQPDSSATTELALQVARSGTWILELRQAGGAWTEQTYIGLQPDVHWVKGQARSCDFAVKWFSGCNDETDAANLIRLRIEARVTAIITTADGTEAIVKFQGPIVSIEQTDYEIKCSCMDWSILYNENDCVVELTPTIVELIDDNPRGRVYLIAGGAYGKVYGLDVGEYPNAFNEALTARRSWVPGTTQLWMTSDTSKTTGQYIVPPSHWRIDYESGAISILEPDHAVTDFTDATHLKIAGDFTKFFLDTVQFTIVGSTSNDGVYTCDGDATYSGGFTTIKTIEALTVEAAAGTVYRNFYYITNLSVYLETGGTVGMITGANVDLARLVEQAWIYNGDGGMALNAGDYYLPDCGIDLGMAYSYTGLVQGLLEDMSKHFQANLMVYYDPTLVQSGTYPTWTTGKHRMRLVSQASSADWTLQNARQIGQGRATRDVYTRIVVTGKSEMPENSINAATITDWVTGSDGSDTYWAGFDGNTITKGTFAEVYPYIYNGNDAMGALAHNLAATADSPGSTGKYDGWYNFIQGDFGSLQVPVTLVRLVMPSSRNQNAAGGDQRDPTKNQGFWPGVWIQVSKDNTNWYTLAPAFYGNFQPGSVITADETQITFPKFRYFRVYCQAYKEGDSNQSDPAIGIGELAFYFDATYTVVKEISNSALNYYYIGDLAQSNPVNRYYPDLLTRCGGRYITYRQDIGSRYNEFLAHDYALLLYEDKLRQYAAPQWDGTTDLRVEPWNTVAVPDNLGGNVAGILVEEIEWGGLTVKVKGTNYRSTVWGY